MIVQDYNTLTANGNKLVKASVSISAQEEIREGNGICLTESVDFNEVEHQIKIESHSELPVLVDGLIIIHDSSHVP